MANRKAFNIYDYGLLQNLISIPPTVHHKITHVPVSSKKKTQTSLLRPAQYKGNQRGPIFPGTLGCLARDDGYRSGVLPALQEKIRKRSNFSSVLLYNGILERSSAGKTKSFI